MEQKNEQEVEIDLKEIFIILLDRLWVIIFTGVLLAALTGIYTKVFVTPMYTSTAKVYVINRQNEENAVTYSDLQSGSSLTQDYMVMVKGNNVLGQVIDELNLDMTVEDLKERVSVSNETNTRFISISVEDPDPVVAQQIADCMAKISAEVGQDVMDIKKVNIAEEANLPKYPSSPNLKKNILIGGFAGIFLAIVVIIIIFLMNDSIRTSEDVKKYLDLNTLGQIPVLDEGETKKKKKKREKRKKLDVDDIEDDEELGMSSDEDADEKETEKDEESKAEPTESQSKKNGSKRKKGGKQA